MTNEGQSIPASATNEQCLDENNRAIENPLVIVKPVFREQLKAVVAPPALFPPSTIFQIDQCIDWDQMDQYPLQPPDMPNENTFTDNTSVSAHSSSSAIAKELFAAILPPLKNSIKLPIELDSLEKICFEECLIISYKFGVDVSDESTASKGAAHR